MIRKQTKSNIWIGHRESRQDSDFIWIRLVSQIRYFNVQSVVEPMALK